MSFGFAVTRLGRRRRALDRPFPDAWRALLQRRLVHYTRLTHDERDRLEDLIKVFVVDKKWQAARGFDLTDEVKVLIGAMACLLILELDYDAYDTVTWIEVHPTTVVRTGIRDVGVPGVVADGPLPLLGEAEFEGPVTIAWDTALVDARHPERGHNVVYHEFAHKLDMGDQLVDGTPRFDDEADRDRWIEVCTAELEALRAGTGGDLLDPYGAESPAEFFAVATEAFFSLAVELRAEKPALYEVLRSFYRQDPAAREPLG